MTHWQQQARNKAMNEKSRARKQGAQMLEIMRRINGTNGKGKDEIQGNGGLEKSPSQDDQEGREPV